MSRVELAAEVAEDLDRIINHLLEHGVEGVTSRIQDIVAAIDVLERNPLIGRPVNGDKRELVIGRRSDGYLALYRYVAEVDTVFILAIGGQREGSYVRG
jgi:toxin ParE1/3/4